MTKINGRLKKWIDVATCLSVFLLSTLFIFFVYVSYVSIKV